MIGVDRCIEVNPAGTAPEDILKQEDVWRGLVRKAENAVPYVEEITACRILERDATGFTREIEVMGATIEEHITLYPQEKIVFDRLTGSAMGAIQNRIERADNGDLLLRFVFELELTQPDPVMDKALSTAMEGSYLKAVQTTLARIREENREVRAGRQNAPAN